jgi:hypothetical protein
MSLMVRLIMRSHKQLPWENPTQNLDLEIAYPLSSWIAFIKTFMRLISSASSVGAEHSKHYFFSGVAGAAALAAAAASSGLKGISA